MVKVEGPMMSFAASGTLGKIATFATWKGRAYVRSRVVPSNPKSVKQISVRAMFKFLSQEWDGITTLQKATWADLAAATSISPFNAFMGYNQDRWRRGLTPCKEIPPAATGGVGNLAFTSVTAGVRMATVKVTNTTNQDHFGILVARSVDTGFTPGFDSLIAVYSGWGAGAHDYVDSPLAAGTYYYRVRWFDKGGNPKAIWEAEKSAVVTDA